MDINPSFVETCRQRYGHQDQPAEIHLADATSLSKWWAESGLADVYSKPLVVCCNNTIMIMPDTIREVVMHECRRVAGPEGRTLMTFWNGRMFAHGVMGYYKKNPALCGTFDLSPKCIDWDGRNFRSHSGYSSTWLTANEVALWMQAMGLPVIVVERESCETIDEDHVCEAGMGIFVWAKGLEARSEMRSRSRNASIVSVVSTTTDHSDKSDGSIEDGGHGNEGGNGDIDGDVSFDVDGDDD